MSDADVIWNRAALDRGGSSPCAGDWALSSLLRAHGLVMNGGVLHAVEVLTDNDLRAAQDGFRFYGFDDVAVLLMRGRQLLEGHNDESLEHHESQLDNEYARYIADDGVLVEAFERHLKSYPEYYAPAR